LSGNTNWISGNDMTNLNVKTGQQIDVNCFAQNGNALLENAAIYASESSAREITEVTPAMLARLKAAQGN